MAQRYNSYSRRPDLSNTSDLYCKIDDKKLNLPTLKIVLILYCNDKKNQNYIINNLSFTYYTVVS